MSQEWDGWPEYPDDADGGAPHTEAAGGGPGPLDAGPGGPAGFDTDDWDDGSPDPAALHPDGESWWEPEPDPAGGPGHPVAPDPYVDDYSVDDPDTDTGPADPPLEGPAGTPPGGGAEPVYRSTAPPVGADPDLPGEPDLTQPEEDWWAGFPPPIRFGPDPGLEPVDGYPWADAELLGDDTADGGGFPDGGEPPRPRPDVADLAEYAGVELPPGADPWQELADSDDPATSALARFWAPDDPSVG